uniref:Uncharacterized protein n=1 Tax=Siphoviridae sp. ctqK313 TaxID=2827946 RepID=A0A8S5TAJ8_9CAUD|nr:MAG TPA: hypothetical protein [Siphoviridae sp. ctqK313]DAL17259.1 MAG TPA_asm: hypothetical protein [Caudoviricetes sp.]DAP30165.1 MAG TPA: hypothetical protein [Caudoviricetes sp.]DAZ65875.1 MAG TPA: hypothetical protein [Caudoviricetes sp.]
MIIYHILNKSSRLKTLKLKILKICIDIMKTQCYIIISSKH